MTRLERTFETTLAAMRSTKPEPPRFSVACECGSQRVNVEAEAWGGCECCGSGATLKWACLDCGAKREGDMTEGKIE